MTDSKAFRSAVTYRGVKSKNLAEILGITPYGLQKKIDNRSEFKADEIVKLTAALQLSEQAREQIFFLPRIVIINQPQKGDNMHELEIKKVPFMGTELMAARDADGQIWAGVRWMCNGIGLSIGQTNREINKIRTDEVLKEGNTKFGIPSNGGPQETLCLKLDFVPLWLAKISITPAMKGEHPELAETLKHYQLHAKDVLATAFLPTLYGTENKLSVQQRVLTPDDYLRAASIVATCANGRLPYVLGFLEKVGFEIPKVEAAKPQESELAQVINDAINEHGLTVTIIREMTGITRAQIYRYRNGQIPRGDRAERLIRALREVIAEAEN